MKNISLIIGASFLIFILYSCGPAVPTKEIEDAKTALERAKTVDAPVYAAQDYMEAQEDLNQANNLLDAKKNQEAHDKAVMSKNAADKSYESARTARAEDIFQKCGAMLTTADQNFAGKLEPDKYGGVTNDYANLKEIYNKHDHDSIYSNGSLLYPKVKDLADYSSGMVNKAKDEVATAQNQYDEAADKEIVKQFAMDDLKAAEPLIDDARTSLTNGELDNTISKAKEAESLIDAAEKKAESAYQSSVKGSTNMMQTVDIDKQKEIEKEKKQASDAINSAKKKLDQLKTRMKGSFLRSSLSLFAYIELPYIYIGDDVLSPDNISNSNISSDSNSNSISTNTESQSVTSPQNQTNLISPVKDEDITQEMVEKYLKLAEDSYNKEEYLDAIDYANEASRMSDILLAREQFQIYTVKLRPGNRDCLWKISGFM